MGFARAMLAVEKSDEVGAGLRPRDYVNVLA